MPYTAILFLIAALAICGLPPFNGFVSEFIIYSGAFGNLQTANFNFDLLFLGVILSLALIGGLAIFCFVKVFGIVFLGNARTKNISEAHEVSIDMLMPKFLIGILIVAIGVAPILFVPFAVKAAGVFGDIGVLPAGILTSLSWTGILSGLLIVMVLGLYGIKKVCQKNKVISHNETWGCAYKGADAARHQYTATSFADNHLEFLKPLFAEDKKFEQFAEEEIFPSKRDFSSHAEDLFEEKLINTPARFIKKIFSGENFLLQSAQLQHYVFYAISFFAIILILTLLKII
jgi:NADH:ubiquinone oxidoreductase subunit 5 (subunit L)/multisubunit Na+/H+ antiporter MnhA subunit